MKQYYYFILIGLITFCFSCQPTTSADAGKNATTTSAEAKDGITSKAEFIKLLEGETSPQLIDVRTPQEFSQGAIEGAINYDYYNDDFTGQMAGLDKSRPVYIYCQSGGRSGKACKMLKKMGVEKIYDLEGGYKVWK